MAGFALGGSIRVLRIALQGPWLCIQWVSGQGREEVAGWLVEPWSRQQPEPAGLKQRCGRKCRSLQLPSARSPAGLFALKIPKMQLTPHLDLILFAYRNTAYLLKWAAASLWRRRSKREQPLVQKPPGHRGAVLAGLTLRTRLGRSIPAPSPFFWPSQISSLH